VREGEYVNREALLLLLLGALALVGGIALYSPRAAVITGGIILLIGGVLTLDVPAAKPKDRKS
jgi:uncharacterized membrane protein YccC